MQSRRPTDGPVKPQYLKAIALPILVSLTAISGHTSRGARNHLHDQRHREPAYAVMRNRRESRPLSERRSGRQNALRQYRSTALCTFCSARKCHSRRHGRARLWTPLPVMACVPLSKATKWNGLGLGRFECQTQIFQSRAQGVLNAKCIELVLETHDKVIDIAHQVSFALQSALDHTFKSQIKHVAQTHVTEEHTNHASHNAPFGPPGSFVDGATRNTTLTCSYQFPRVWPRCGLGRAALKTPWRPYLRLPSRLGRTIVTH
jgi:hypothetical protein